MRRKYQYYLDLSLFAVVVGTLIAIGYQLMVVIYAFFEVWMYAMRNTSMPHRDTLLWIIPSMLFAMGDLIIPFYVYVIDWIKEQWNIMQQAYKNQ